VNEKIWSPLFGVGLFPLLFHASGTVCRFTSPHHSLDRLSKRGCSCFVLRQPGTSLGHKICGVDTYGECRVWAYNCSLGWSILSPPSLFWSCEPSSFRMPKGSGKFALLFFFKLASQAPNMTNPLSHPPHKICTSVWQNWGGHVHPMARGDSLFFCTPQLQFCLLYFWHSSGVWV